MMKFIVDLLSIDFHQYSVTSNDDSKKSLFTLVVTHKRFCPQIFGIVIQIYSMTAMLFSTYHTYIIKIMLS